MILFRNWILLLQNHELNLWGAVLGQHLVARDGHFIPVPSVVECGQGIIGEAALHWRV